MAASGLAHPLLLSTIFHMDQITVAGMTIETKCVFHLARHGHSARGRHRAAQKHQPRARKVPALLRDACGRTGKVRAEQSR